MKPLDKLVHGVIWPAVAGSILWTFLLVVIDPHGADGPIWPRLLVLLLVGVYLAIDWMDTESIEGNTAKCSWLADMSLAASLSTFAVATQFNAWWSAWPLGFAFAFAIIGHLAGAWDQRTVSRASRARKALAGINALGIVALVISLFLGECYAKWSNLVAMAVVVFLYFLCRRRILTKKWPFGPARR